jgi:hypothetical protein
MNKEQRSINVDIVIKRLNTNQLGVREPDGELYTI